MIDIVDKVAVVTGARIGIGKEIAMHLLKEGVKVAICSRNERGLVQTVEDLKNQAPGISIFHKKADVSNSFEVQSFVSSVLEEFGRIDILINNAGVIKTGPIEEITEDDYDYMMNINLKGPFLTMKNIIPVMKKQGSGHIINISSVAGNSPIPRMSIYCASKYGLKGLSQTAREELKKENISVTTIYPGAVDTSIWNNINSEADHSRMIKPTTIAEAVIFALKHSDTGVIDDITVTPKGVRV